MKARETTLAEGGRSQGVRAFLQGGAAGNYIVWVKNVGPFSNNGKEDRGDAHIVPANNHGEESEEIRRWYMGDTGSEGIREAAGNPVG